MYISLVIPAYNEEKNIPILYERIVSVMEKHKFECIFVDDGSSDGTFEMIKQLSQKFDEVKGLAFSRNFGHQTALLAGVSDAKGDVIITMDADGQHPPELIPDLLNKMNEGYDVVNTKRNLTADAGLFKNLTSSWYYKIINKLTEVRIEPASSDFRLMSRTAVDAFLSFPEKDRFTRGIISWMGFHQSVVHFDAPARMSGQSKYTLKKMVRFAWDGVTSFSSKPLKISMVFGVLSLIFGLLYATYTIVIFFLGKAIPGWTSMMLVILFLGGIQLLSLGIIGEYLARIFSESKNRPHFFIRDRC
ncbi:MAG TPA: glycosyltransferase family 2 protein [Prolixibacteraceae bacterium]|nr:glycosyltransferase family 2 protein [Prolixibacteraceae bacterium]